MAYQYQTITAITDIPALAASFAVAQGWTVDVTTPTQPIFRLPTTATPILWKLSAAISGQDHTLTWTASGSAVPTSTANTRSPKFAPLSGTTAVVPAPTKVHMFISPSPSETPYLAITIEYGANSFRHLYLGSMEKLGNYTGGEIVSGSGGAFTGTSGSIDYRNYTYMSYLFQGRTGAWANTACGGVRVTHADNPNEWRKFVGANSSTLTAMPADSVLGGFGDGVNDPYLARAKAPFAGSNILVPINLYACKPITSDLSFVPIGRPPGVRLVNMTNLDPGSLITVGTVNWRVFPAITKSTDTAQPGDNAHGFWRTAESSYVVGYAFRET